MSDIYTILQNKYPEITLEEAPYLDEYFKNNSNVAGMAIGAGLNGISGERKVIYNPYSNLQDYQKQALILNEKLRHLMDEENFKLNRVRLKQKNAYKETPYEGDDLNIGRTEAARYLSEDKNHLNRRQKKYVDNFINKIDYKEGGPTTKDENTNGNDKSPWDSLSMEDKAFHINNAVKYGFSKDLNEIKDMYNYIATMEKVAKDNHENWGESEEESLLRILNSSDYDYKGYYKKYPQSNANSKIHWNDEFKTVYHPTFSDESIYSGIKSKYNPDGIKGGSWQGNAYIPSQEQLDSRYFNEEKTRRYLENGQEYLQIPNKKYDGGGPKEGDYFGAHLPEVVVVGKKPNKRSQFTGFPNVFRDASIFDSQLQKVTNVLGYFPYIGEGADIVSTVNDAANKRYLDAGLSIAAMGIPFIPAAAVKKYVKEPVKKIFNKTAEGLSDFYNNVVKPKLAGMHIGDWYFTFPKIDENYMYRQTTGVYPNVEARGALYPESNNHYKKRNAAHKKKYTEEYFKEHGEYPKFILNLKHFRNDLMFNQSRPFYGLNPSHYDEIFVVPNKGIADWNKIYHKGHKLIREPRVNGELMLPLEDFEYYKRLKIFPGYIKLKDVGETKLHNFRLFDEGGPKESEYNIFEDPKSFEGRDQHRKSLDAFVKNNPKLYGLNTADFVEFLSQIAGLESGYRSGATTDASTYSGYYGLKNGHTFDVNTQHKKAFQHLASIFKENMTKQDIDKAHSLGITPAQLLAKYWNQGNRVTNYLYNSIDNEDALGTKISKYGWNVTAPVEYKDLVPEAITDSYIIIEDARSLPDGIARARNNSIDYSNREKSILQLNDSINPYGFTVKKFNPNKLQKGQKVKLMSDNERERKLLVKKLMDSFNVDSLLNNPYSKYINNIMNSWKQ